jgi:hypothetical protein
VIGPLMIVPRTASRTASASILRGQPTPLRHIEFTLDVFVDPAVWLDGIARELQVEVARDQDGRSLVAADNARRPEIASVYRRNSWVQPIRVPLQYPPPESTRLAELRGTLRVSVVTRVDTLRLGDLARDRQEDLHLGDARLRLRGAQSQAAGAWELPLTLWRDGRDGAAWDELRRSVREADLRITDAAGRPMRTRVELNTGNGESFSGFISAQQYHSGPRPAPPAVPPAKLTWSLPVDAREVAVPVEFHDLPLP